VEGDGPVPASGCGEVPLTLTARVADVATAYPETIPIFLQFGITMITDPLMRRTVARSVSREQVCRLRRVDSAQLWAVLRAGQRPGGANGGPDQPVTISGTSAPADTLPL